MIRRTIPSARRPGAAAAAALAVLALALGPLDASRVHAQYLYIDTNGNGVRDGGDLLNAGCATTLGIWLDTDSNRAGDPELCDASGRPLTINSYYFTLHVEGGTVSWGAVQNDQPGMNFSLRQLSGATDLEVGYGGSAVLPAGTYHLADVGVTPLTGAPVIDFSETSLSGADSGTNFGTSCEGLGCDHTYRLGVDWFDTEGVGPPTDATPPSITVPASVSVEEGTTLRFVVTASDCEAIDVLGADLSSLPPGNDAVFVPGIHRTDGVVTWTPTFDDQGVYPVTFIAGNDKSSTATTTIEVVNQTKIVPYGDAGYRFLQLPQGFPFPPGVTAPGYDDSVFPIGSAPFGDTNCPGILPETHWITSTSMVARRRFAPGSAVAGAKVRFLIDNDATIYLNGAQIAVANHQGCPARDDYVVSLPDGTVQPDSNVLVALCTDEGGWSSFDVAVTAVDVGPVVAAPESVVVLEGDPVTVNVSVADPEGDAVSFLTADTTDLPPGNDAAFTEDPIHTSGTLTWTPQNGDARSEPYRVAFDAGNTLTGTRATAIRVTDIDTAPVVTAPAEASGNYGTPITFTVTASDPEGQPVDSLTADLGGLPVGSGAVFTASASADSGAFSWAPDLDAVSPTPYVATFTAWNTLSATAMTEITVTDVDLPPNVTAPASASTTENAAVAVPVTASDPDGDPIGALVADLAGLPAGNTASFTPGPLNLTGTLTWTPTYDDGRVPPYQVAFIAANALSDTARTSISVLNVDRGPVVTAPAVAVGPPDTELAFSVTAGDPDGDTIDSLTVEALPPGAAFVPAPDHLSASFSWTPTAGDLCTRRSVRFIAANLIADTTETVITVSGGSCPPVVTAPATVGGLGGTRIDVPVSAIDPDGEAVTSLTADLSGLPAGSDAIFGITAPDRSSGMLSWTPTPLIEGAFSVAFTASNLLTGTAATQILVTATSGAATRRVSVSSAGVEANASSYDGRISSGGRYVVFRSNASNLVGDDTNLRSDVFRRDLVMGTTVRVSVDSLGAQGNGSSLDPYASSDGRFVAFTSASSNLVPGDLNGVEDVFVRDLDTGSVERASVGPFGLEANGSSFASGISADGRFVAFCSDASNLVADDTNGVTDMFVRDRTLGVTKLVSRDSNGTLGNARSCENSYGALSADGRFVVFPSIATNLVPDDTNGRNDVFLHDLATDSTTIVSRSTPGQPSNGLSAWPAVDSDGRYVAFSSFASNLVAGDGNGTWDIFVRDRVLGTTERVSVNASGVEGNANSGYAALTDNGAGVAFLSYAWNLVPADGNGIADIFLRDRAQSTTERASTSGNSVEATGPNAEVGTVSVSGDGRLVVFCMAATNLVPGDTNGAIDVFVRDREQSVSTAQSNPAPISRRSLLAYPNPAGRGVNFSFYATGAAPTALRIFDVHGRLIRDLPAARSAVSPVRYFWDGRDARARPVASGVYFAVASDGASRTTSKIVIMR